MLSFCEELFFLSDMQIPCGMVDSGEAEQWPGIWKGRGKGLAARPTLSVGNWRHLPDPPSSGCMGSPSEPCSSSWESCGGQGEDPSLPPSPVVGISDHHQPLPWGVHSPAIYGSLLYPSPIPKSSTSQDFTGISAGGPGAWTLKREGSSEASEEFQAGLEMGLVQKVLVTRICILRRS